MHWATRQLASIPISDPFIPPALICSFSCCWCSSIFSIYALDLDRHLAVIFSLVDRVDVLLEPTQAIYAVVKKNQTETDENTTNISRLRPDIWRSMDTADTSIGSNDSSATTSAPSSDHVEPCIPLIASASSAISRSLSNTDGFVSAM